MKRNTVILAMSLLSISFTIIFIGVYMDSLNPVKSQMFIPSNYTVISQYYKSFNVIEIDDYNKTSNTATFVINGEYYVFPKYLHNVLLNGTLSRNTNGIILDTRDNNFYTFLEINEEPQSCIKEVTFKNGTVSLEPYSERYESGRSLQVQCDIWKTRYVMIDE